MRIECQGNSEIRPADRLPQGRLRRLLFRSKRKLERQLAEIDSLAFRADAGGPVRNSSEGAQGCEASNELVSLLRELSRQYPGRVLIAYGSRISGEADAYSDLDVLVIEYDRNLAPVHETSIVNCLEVDITRVGFNVVVKGMKGRCRHNNNWFLNALRECLIYDDRDGDAQRLKSIAEGLWKKGPHALTPRQLEAGRAGLLRLLESAEKLSERANKSAEARRLARMRCDQLVASSIYMFYSMRGLWTTSLHRLLRKCKLEYPELYHLWLRYAESSDSNETIRAAECIVEGVLGGVLLPTRQPQGVTDITCVARARTN